MTELDLDAAGGRTNGLQMRGGEIEDLLGILVGDEAEAELRHGFPSDHGLRSFALITASDAVDFGGGASPATLERGVAGLAPESGGTRFDEGGGVAIGQARPHLAFPRFEGKDAIVETGDVDAALVVVERGDDARDHRRGIRHGAAVNARMQIANGAVDLEFEAGDAAETVGHGGNARADHARVGNGADVAFQLVPMLCEEGREIRRADLLFALEEKDHVHRQVTVGFQGFLDAEEVGEMLALVVGRSAGVDLVTDEGRFEGRGIPFGNRIDRLHVVVAIDQDGGTARLRCAAGHEDGMTGRLVEFCQEPHRAAFVHEEFGAAPHVFAMTAIRRDTREAEEVEEFGELWAHGGGGGRRFAP